MAEILVEDTMTKAPPTNLDIPALPGIPALKAKVHPVCALWNIFDLEIDVYSIMDIAFWQCTHMGVHGWGTL